jgi:hypothetical protein
VIALFCFPVEERGGVFAPARRGEGRIIRSNEEGIIAQTVRRVFGLNLKRRIEA